MAARRHKLGYPITILFSIILGGWLQHLGSVAYIQWKDVMTVYHQPKDKAPAKEFVPAMTPMNVLSEICKADIAEPLIVFKQAMHETNSLQCSNCSLDYNNLFGFMGNSGFLRFQTWVDSIKHYKEYQEERLKPGEDYYKFLVRIRYAEDPDYINKLRGLKY